MGGAGHDHSTGREGKAGLVGQGMGSTEEEGAAEVEVGDENGVAASGPVPQMEALEEEAGPRRPLEVVRGHSQFGWNHQSVSIDRPWWDFLTERFWSGSRARTRWQP